MPWHATHWRFVAAGAAGVGVLILAVFVFAWVRGRNSGPTVVAAPPAPAPARVAAPAETVGRGSTAATVITATTVAAVARPEPGSSLAATAALPPPPTPAPATYQVQDGDSLWSIARSVGVDQDALLALNPGSDVRLPVGSQLLLPITATPDSAASVSATEAVPLAATPIVVAPPAVYLAQPGDTLASIAGDHGLRVADLSAMNEQELSGDTSVSPGQLLRVRSDVNSAGSAEGPSPPFAAPLMLAPADGAIVHDDVSWLRWASAGILPEDAYYVVALRDADAPDSAAVETVWVANNATTLAVPATLRPAMGRSRHLAWTVTVRRSADGRPGPGDGELLSAAPAEHSFTWTP